MKYENEEYKRNFKFSPAKSQPSSSSGVDSVESTKQTEEPQDDIQVKTISRIRFSISFLFYSNAFHLFSC